MSDTKNPNVLIIDDSKAIGLALKEILFDLGLESVECCLSGLSALKMIKDEPSRFDALFVDLHLPDFDGMELMMQLDKLNYRGGVIIISGLDSKILELAENIVKSTGLKLLGSAAKPFSLSLMAFLVKRIRYLRNRAVNEADFVKRRELQDAIRQQALVPYYQPKIDRAFNHLVGVECLARIDIAGKGRVTPEQFIPVAEKFALYDEFFELLLDKALPEYLEMTQRRKILSPLSINILPSQLKNDKIINLLEEKTKLHHFNKKMVMLEVTEQQALNSQEQLKNLNRLRINGYRLSLDDYGSGYTNLSQIKNLPFNEVKLDGKMVTGIAHDKLLRVICESTLKVTRALNIFLVAEGIEHQEDIDVLQSIGIDGYQGYAICRPKPLSEFERWFKMWQNFSKSSPSRIS